MQIVHAVVPVENEKVPAAQLVQIEAPVTEYLPAAQLVQEEAPVNE